MLAYLLDTNHVSALLDGFSPLESRIQDALGRQAEFGISTTVLGELYYAAFASRRRQANLLRIDRFLATVRVWVYDDLVAQEFGRLRAELRDKGRPIPPTDVQIAAVSRLHGLVLLTADRHFAYVDHLQVENWLEGGESAP